MNTIFENQRTCNGILFRYAKGKTLRAGNEVHPYHEILYFIKGGGRCFTEHFDMEIQDHTLFVIPKNTYHRFAVKDQKNYTRLTLTFDDCDNIGDIALLLDNRVGILDATDTDLSFLLTKICSTLDEKCTNIKADSLLYGAFLMLISEISAGERSILSPEPDAGRELISRCTAYIDGNFSRDISVDELAALMNVSASALFWHFKKHLGISVYKYISQKRIAHAHMLISQNKMPTKIYLECGYHDYATFYKAYMKYFGYPPSAHRKKTSVG